MSGVAPSAIVAADAERARRRRTMLVAGAVLFGGLDLAVKASAEHGLGGGQRIDVGVAELRLAFNPGVAFSLGAGLPSWLVLTVTGLITLGLAVYAVRAAATTGLAACLALSAVVAGAAGNLLDRAGDGVVTDYLHTGWFPTFNLADVLITTGGALLVLLALRGTASLEGSA